jgi:hemolysin activation/secretion protein
LPWGHRLLLYGSLSQSAPMMTVAATNLKGESQSIGGHYTIPFENISSDDNKWTFEHSFIGGFDYKNSNSNLTFAGVQVFAQAVDIGEFVVGYETKLTDALGYTRVYPTVTYSPGKIFENGDELAFAAQRPGADPSYTIVGLEWERSFTLPENFEFNTSGRYQLPTSNLVGIEQMGLGGSSTIRGFPERFASGDEGYYMMNELRFPPLAMSKLAGFSSSDTDRLLFYGFFDYGEVGPHSFNAASTVEDEALSSAGLGFRYKLSSYLTMELSYGFRLITPQTGDAGGQALSYSFTLSY